MVVVGGGITSKSPHVVLGELAVAAAATAHQPTVARIRRHVHHVALLGSNESNVFEAENVFLQAPLPATPITSRSPSKSTIYFLERTPASPGDSNRRRRRRSKATAPRRRSRRFVCNEKCADHQTSRDDRWGRAKSDARRRRRRRSRGRWESRLTAGERRRRRRAARRAAARGRARNWPGTFPSRRRGARTTNRRRCAAPIRSDRPPVPHQRRD